MSGSGNGVRDVSWVHKIIFLKNSKEKWKCLHIHVSSRYKDALFHVFFYPQVSERILNFLFNHVVSRL